MSAKKKNSIIEKRPHKEKHLELFYKQIRAKKGNTDRKII